MSKEQLEIGDKIKVTYKTIEGVFWESILEVESVTKTKAVLTNCTTFKRSLAKGLTLYNSLSNSEYKYHILD